MRLYIVNKCITCKVTAFFMLKCQPKYNHFNFSFSGILDEFLTNPELWIRGGMRIIQR